MLATSLPAQQTETSTTNTSESAAAATKEEVNVGSFSLGARPVEVAGTAAGLDQVLAGTAGALAQLQPGANGTAATVIDLSGQADLSRVALEVGNVKGRLVLMALNEDGDMVDLSTPDGSKYLISDQTLDGSKSTISVDVSQLKAKSVMIYWVPDTPGESLPISKFGIFTKEAVVPDLAGVPTRVPPSPVVPSPEVVKAARDTFFSAGSTTTTTTTTTTTALPETIPPSSRNVSL